MSEHQVEPEASEFRVLPFVFQLLTLMGLVMLIPLIPLWVIAVLFWVHLPPWHERVADDYNAYLTVESIPHLGSLSDLGIREVSMGPGMANLLDRVDRSMIGITIGGPALFNASPDLDVLTGFSNLRSLSLGPNIDSDLSRLLPRLHELPLRDLSIEGDELLRTLATEPSSVLLPQLCSLTLKGSDPTAISAALAAFSQIRVRCLTIACATKGSPPLGVLPRMRDVLRVRIDGFRVGAKSVRGLLSRSTTCLDLDQCAALTEDDAIELAGLCSMGTLTLKLPNHVDQLYVRGHIEWQYNPRMLHIESKFLYPPESQQTSVRR